MFLHVLVLRQTVVDCCFVPFPFITFSIARCSLRSLQSLHTSLISLLFIVESARPSACILCTLSAVNIEQVVNPRFDVAIYLPARHDSVISITSQLKKPTSSERKNVSIVALVWLCLIQRWKNVGDFCYRFDRSFFPEKQILKSILGYTNTRHLGWRITEEHMLLEQPHHLHVTKPCLCRKLAVAKWVWIFPSYNWQWRCLGASHDGTQEGASTSKSEMLKCPSTASENPPPVFNRYCENGQ